MVDANSLQLGQGADVRAGYPFRGGVVPAEQGPAWVVQMKDLDAAGNVRWAQVVRAHLPGRKAPDWLQASDLLVVARGNRFHSACLDEPPGPTVCGPHFFRLRVKPGVPLLPAFLAWQINRAPAQRFLSSHAEGSDQLSIRRGVLESLPVAVPPLETQRSIVGLAAAANEERTRLEALIRNRQQQLDALAFELLAGLGQAGGSGSGSGSGSVSGSVPRA